MKLLPQYVDRGWKLVSIPKGAKAPLGRNAKGWQTNYNVKPSNIKGNVGILLGEPSGWLIDIDLDWPEAAELAPEFLPDTRAIFGRASNPDSHYLYIVPGAKTRKWAHGKKSEGGMIVELRSTGHQTIFPGSTHPSGELIEWTEFSVVAEVSPEQLEMACGNLAASALLVRHWTDGIRQDLSFAIAGMLLKEQRSIEFTKHLLGCVARTAKDNEPDKRVGTVERTARSLAAGGAISGFTTLKDTLGPILAQRIADFLGVSALSNVPDNHIVITGHSSKYLAQLAWEGLSDAKDLFVFGEEVARVAGAEIQPLTRDGFWQEVASQTDWVMQKGKKIIATDPPMATIMYMRNQRASDIPLFKLNGITTTPVMSLSGEIHSTPGYAACSQFYYEPSCEIPPIDDKPTLKTVGKALAALEEVIVDFPFVHSSDRAHALAMILLPFVRPMINGPTPLHLLDKPMQGTGATLLAEAATLIKTGVALPAQAAPSQKEEWEKVILSSLLKAPEFVFLDNVRSIYSDTLAVVLTASVYEGRRLGVSEMVKIPIRTTWIMTGNNVKMGDDFLRRLVQIRLDANLYDPTIRNNFKHPELHSWIAEERGNLIWAALTLARFWITKGKPHPVKTKATYENWAHVVGGILEVAGVEGFLDTPEERKDATDPFRELEMEFVRCWLAHVFRAASNSVLRSGQLLNLCDVCDLEFKFAPRGKEMNSMIFARDRMSRLADRVFNVRTMDSHIVRVKVKRGSARGHAAWELAILEGGKDIGPDDVWQGPMWTG